MPLGLVPRDRIQGQGWPVQEVHHCATHVMVAYQEKNDRIYLYGLNTKAVNMPINACRIIKKSATVVVGWTKHMHVYSAHTNTLPVTNLATFSGPFRI